MAEAFWKLIVSRPEKAARINPLECTVREGFITFMATYCCWAAGKNMVALLLHFPQQQITT